MYGVNGKVDIVAAPFEVTVEEEVANKAQKLRDAKRTARRLAKERGAFCDGKCR